MNSIVFIAKFIQNSIFYILIKFPHSHPTPSVLVLILLLLPRRRRRQHRRYSSLWKQCYTARRRIDHRCNLDALPSTESDLPITVCAGVLCSTTSSFCFFSGERSSILAIRASLTLKHDKPHLDMLLHSPQLARCPQHHAPKRERLPDGLWPTKRQRPQDADPRLSRPHAVHPHETKRDRILFQAPVPSLVVRTRLARTDRRPRSQLRRQRHRTRPRNVPAKVLLKSSSKYSVESQVSSSSLAVADACIDTSGRLDRIVLPHWSIGTCWSVSWRSWRRRMRRERSCEAVDLLWLYRHLHTRGRLPTMRWRLQTRRLDVKSITRPESHHCPRLRRLRPLRSPSSFRSLHYLTALVERINSSLI